MQKNDSPHLSTGAPCPPLTDNLRLYSMLYCPYAQRVLLVAAAKQIMLDVVNMNCTDRPEWIYEKYHSGKVPLLEFPGGTVLSESLIISDYLNDIGKNTPLYPVGPPIGKAMDRLWITKFDSDVIPHIFKLFFQVDLKGSAAEVEVNDLSSALTKFEMELEKRGTKYFGGNANPGMLDYMIWPFIERIPVVKQIHNLMPKIQSSPIWAKWFQDMVSDPAVKSTYFSKEIHYIYLNSRRQGKVLYDFAK